MLTSKRNAEEQEEVLTSRGTAEEQEGLQKRRRRWLRA